MLTAIEYTKQSIETNLFFLRIMKEHLIFAGAALSLQDASLVTREAEHYLQHIETLQNHQSLIDGPKTAAMSEFFWNMIMEEHSKFIRGLLDPTEEELIQKANGFAGQFDELTQKARKAFEQIELLPGVTHNSMAATMDIKNFKEQGTQGILECKIRSIILPLLSDHVLREANHYLKELREFKI